MDNDEIGRLFEALDRNARAAQALIEQCRATINRLQAWNDEQAKLIRHYEAEGTPGFRERAETWVSIEDGTGGFLSVSPEQAGKVAERERRAMRGPVEPKILAALPRALLDEIEDDLAWVFPVPDDKTRYIEVDQTTFNALTTPRP